MIIPWRKVLRFGGGLLFPILYFFIEKNPILILLGAFTALFLIIELLRFKFPKVAAKLFGGMKKVTKAIAKKKERKRISGAAWVLLGSFLTVLFFEKTIAITAIFFLIFGDTLAGFIGLKFGRIKIGKKSLEGSLACFASCVIVGFILSLWLPLTWLLILFGALGATLAELIPTRIIDDNFTMAIIAALFMFLITLV